MPWGPRQHWRMGPWGRTTSCAVDSQLAVAARERVCREASILSHGVPDGTQERVHGEGHVSVLLGSQRMVDPVTRLTFASPRALPVYLGMASPAVATHTGHPCRGSAGSRRLGEFQEALQGREVLGDRGHHRQYCQGHSHPSVDPPATSSRRERSRWLPTEQL